MATSHSLNTSKKQERLDFRVSKAIKDTLAYAAMLQGLSTSTFAVKAAYDKARKVIDDYDNLVLSDREREKFLNLLENPTKQNAKLKSAMKKYLKGN